MALPHAQPGEVVDLRPLGQALNQTKTAALVKSSQFEAVRLVSHQASTFLNTASPGRSLSSASKDGLRFTPAKT
jgi:hypothetical protein